MHSFDQVWSILISFCAAVLWLVEAWRIAMSNASKGSNLILAFLLIGKNCNIHWIGSFIITASSHSLLPGHRPWGGLPMVLCVCYWTHQITSTQFKDSRLLAILGWPVTVSLGYQTDFCWLLFVLGRCMVDHVDQATGTGTANGLLCNGSSVSNKAFA